MELKQVVIMRNDLNMGRGKIAAQACHASLGASEEVKQTDLSLWKAWKGNLEKVIVLTASLEDILVIEVLCNNDNIPCKLIIDAGLTEIMEHTVTCLGIGPVEADRINLITGDLDLLR